MQLSIRSLFSKDLQQRYQKEEEPQQTQVITGLTQQEIDRYAQTQKEQTEKYMEGKRRREKKFQKLSKQQIAQITQFLKNDSQFKEIFAQSIIKHTELSQIMQQVENMKIMKQLSTIVIDFRIKMTETIQGMFITHQNQMTAKLYKLLLGKTDLLMQVFSQRILLYNEIKPYQKQALLTQLDVILKKEVFENSKKYAQAMTQQFIILNEGVMQIIGQHVEINRDSKFEAELFCQINKIKEYFSQFESFFIKRLQTDVNEYYMNIIALLLQAQEKLKNQ